MQEAPILENEKERLEALHRLAILDTKPEERFDKITQEAVSKLDVPISMISIIDSKREWYKSGYGVKEKEGKRKTSFCGHALYFSGIFIIEDTLKDARFADNPAVLNYPFIRFYAGIALYDYKTSLPIGVFCVKDIRPRKFGEKEIKILVKLAEEAERELNIKID